MPRRPTRTELVADVLPAVAFLVLAQVEALIGGYDGRLALAVAGAAIALAMAFRRRALLPSMAGLLVVLGALTAAGVTTNTVAVIVAYVMWSYSAGAQLRGGPAWAALVVMVGSSWLAIAMGRDEVAIGDFVFTAILFLGAAGLGRALRRRGVEVELLAERAERAEVEQAQRAREAVLEERARIARELHDVVAHAVSVMVMQTGVVRRRLQSRGEPDAALLTEVEQTGRAALAEMRRLLGLLRVGEEGPDLAPQPGVAQIDDLVEKMREAGMPVDLRVEGDPVALPAGIGLAVYRIVQEGLTNSLKHAGRARSRVRLRYRPRQLEVELTDDGPGRTTGDRRGHGLVGMRERVNVYGGTLDAGPCDQGGFRVHVVLPLDGPA